MNLSKCLGLVSMFMLAMIVQLQPVEASFSRIVAFGDSLTDNGNLPDAYQPPAPYFNGRFSNGKVWVEDLVKDAKAAFNLRRVRLEDYALGGAWAEGYEVSHLAIPKGLRWISLTICYKAHSLPHAHERRG